MQKAYERIGWENYPSDKSPLNKNNLNKMDTATDEIDNRVIALDTTKLDKTTAATLIKDVSLDESSGIFTITRLNGSVVTFDTKLEKLAVNFSYNKEAQQLVIILEDGTEQTVDLSALISEYEFADSGTIAFSVDGTGKISAIVKDGCITEDKLQPNYLADIKTETAKATSMAAAASNSASTANISASTATTKANEAAASATNAKNYAEQAKSATQALSLDPLASEETPIQNAYVRYIHCPSYGGINSDEDYSVTSTMFDVFCTDWAGVILNVDSHLYFEVMESNASLYAHDVITGGVNLGYSGNPWKQLYASTSTIATSDREKKKDIEDLDAELIINFIMGLKPVQFKFKDGDSGRTHYGLISQDIEELLEKIGLSSKDFAGFIKSPKIKIIEEEYKDDGGRKRKRHYTKKTEGEYDYSLRYEEFISPLIKMVQFQQAEIDGLKAENEELKDKMNSFEERLKKLEEQQ